MHKIVLVDDEIKLLKALKKSLENDGYEVFDFPSPISALEFLQKRPVDLVVSDIRMSGMSGIELLKHIKGLKQKSPPCILMTAFSSVETAVTAVKLGAIDYLLKPFELEDFRNAIKKALQRTFEMDENPENIQVLIGSSPGIKEVKRIIENISDTDSTVLISGESGTGKELVARAIHRSSKRANLPFVPVNCSAIPESLFESEMFGHKRGSFTGAIADKPGIFADAEGGTLFLDEIGDLTLPNQAKLLRVLQDGIFKPVGANISLKSDVRIIAASNKQLKEEVKSGNFREDLLYRINIVEILIPPLRKRKEDIRELAEHFINQFSRRHGRLVNQGSKEFFELLTAYEWPGNIRQLENCIERAVIMKRSGQLESADLNLPAGESNNNSPLINDDLSNMPLQETINKIEENIILQALDTAGWNYSKAASNLGITRQNLHYKLKKYGISKEE
ncbi:MAG: sigma-54-dependent transcriptional regulator [Candidatus Rifleibacteriota bacterium]